MSVWELEFADSGAHEATNHKAEVAIVEGRTDGVGGDDGRNIGWHDPDGFYSSGWEAEDGADGSGDCGYEVRVWTVVEVDGDVGEERCRED